MAAVMLNVYETWFTSPNQERTSVRFLGVGNSEIAWTYFLHGLTVVSVISKPANSTSSLAKQNFSGLRVIPFLPQISSHSAAFPYASAMLLDHRRASSMHFVFSVMWAMMPSYLLV